MLSSSEDIHSESRELFLSQNRFFFPQKEKKKKKNGRVLAGTATRPAQTRGKLIAAAFETAGTMRAFKPRGDKFPGMKFQTVFCKPHFRLNMIRRRALFPPPSSPRAATKPPDIDQATFP